MCPQIAQINTDLTAGVGLPSNLPKSEGISRSELLRIHYGLVQGFYRNRQL